jgi:ABC-type multidrug transport system fused ATPase/permease subunit
MNDFRRALLLLGPKLKIKFVALIILSLFGTVIEMLSVSLLIPILNILTGTPEDIVNFLSKNDLTFLIPYLNLKIILLIFLSVYAIKIFFRLFLVHYQNDFIFTFFNFLLNKLYKKYIFKDYLFHLKNNSGVLIRNLLSEIHQCSVGFVGSISNIIIEFIVIIGLILVLILYKPYVVISFMTLTGFIALVVTLILKKKSKLLGQGRQKFSLINLNNIMQSFGGIKEIKVNLKEPQIIKKFYLNSLDLKKVNYLFQMLSQIPRLILELLFIISLVGLLFHLISSGLPSGEVIIFLGLLISIFARILPSIYKLSISYINISYYKPSVKLLFKELITDEDDKLNRYDLNKKHSLEISFNDKIEMKKVSFMYPGTTKEILSKTNLIINKGDKIGIYGESGSGKSTLVDLIVGLLDPTKGQILVDGKDIKKNKKQWFKKIGYVPQSVFLNDDDIRNNVTFYDTKNDKDLKRYNEVIKIAQLEKLVLEENNKDKHNVGERGVQISGGQRQRIGLARSLYKKSEILIFDEPTNALDEKNETNFLNSIFSLKSNNTIIIISHKKNTLKKCNRIFTIKKKKILEI